MVKWHSDVNYTQNVKWQLIQQSIFNFKERGRENLPPVTVLNLEKSIFVIKMAKY